MSIDVSNAPRIQPAPTDPRRMVSRFDVPLNALGEKATIIHPVPMTTDDIHRIALYLSMLPEAK